MSSLNVLPADPVGSTGHRVQSDGAIRVLASGVDSLYMSARGELQNGLDVALRTTREMANDEDVVISYRDEDGSYLLRSHGWRGYPFWLSSPRFELYIGAAKPFPQAYVALHSSFIHTVGVEKAVDSVHSELGGVFFAGDPMFAPSRIDLYADVQGWQPRSDDFGHFVCRAVRRKVFEQPSEMHQVGRMLSGFTFGRGAVVGRIYNKSLEMRVRGSTWQELMWVDRDQDLPVWRIEFQFRRKALTSFGIQTMAAAMDNRQALWEYGMRWLSLRVEGAHTKRSRWAENPVWSTLRDAPMGSPWSQLVRERICAADERRLVSGFVGYMSSLAAMEDNGDISSAVARALPKAMRYLDERGSDFAGVVRRKSEMRKTRVSSAEQAGAQS